MKKLTWFALMMAVMMAILPAMAAVEEVGSYTIDLPDALQQDELTDEDVNAGLMAYFFHEDDQYELAVYAFDPEGMDLNAYVAFCTAELTVEQSGTNVINDVEIGYYVCRDTDEEGEFFAITYVVMDTDAVYEFVFYVSNDENATIASAAAAAVMETLKRAQ